METQIWSKVEDKCASILVLRGPEVHQLKVTGNMLTLKRNLKRALEALEEGKAPAESGAKLVGTLDVRAIGKAEVSPYKDSLTLHGEGAGAKRLKYPTDESNADAILQAILEKSPRTFHSTQEEIGVFEALMPPVVLGGIIGLFWFGAYHTAGRIAAGEKVVASGRRRGLQEILIWVAGTLGTKGIIAVGAVLLALFLGWAAMRIIRRPLRTVWLPAMA